MKLENGLQNKDLLYVWLTSKQGLGVHSQIRALNAFKAVGALYSASADTLAGTGVLTEKEIELLADKSLTTAERILEECVKSGIHVSRPGCKDYPEEFLQQKGMPLLIYIKGELPPMDEKFSIAVVGSRTPTPYGVKMARKFAFDLAHSGTVVVSGLARGLDTQAHGSALNAKGKTVAVVAGGIDVPYPPENEELLEEIALKGAVVSEYPPGTPHVAGHFYPRSRIISGLSKGVLVVECGVESGCHLTVGSALEQGKQVFTIPTMLDLPAGSGNIELMKMGAKIVYEPYDIIHEFTLEYSLEIGDKIEEEKNDVQPEDETQRLILSALSGSLPVHVDELSAGTGKSSAEINAAISILEIEGYIKGVGGRRYIKA